MTRSFVRVRRIQATPNPRPYRRLQLSRLFHVFLKLSDNCFSFVPEIHGLLFLRQSTDCTHRPGLRPGRWLSSHWRLAHLYIGTTSSLSLCALCHRPSLARNEWECRSSRACGKAKIVAGAPEDAWRTRGACWLGRMAPNHRAALLDRVEALTRAILGRSNTSPT